MAMQAELDPTSRAVDVDAADVSRPIAVVLTMPRVSADGQPLIDLAAGEGLGAARGIAIGVGVGAVLWAGLLSLAWRLVH